MSSKMEQRSLEAYPREIEVRLTGSVDHNLTKRKAFLEGYDQALIDVSDWLHRKAHRYTDMYIDCSGLIPDMVKELEGK